MSYESRDTKGQATSAAFDGTVRRDPRAKPKTVVAAFTGNNDLGFPHADVVKHVATSSPTSWSSRATRSTSPSGEFGVQRAPLDEATLDYLRKWFMFGWEYRDLLRHIPSVCDARRSRRLPRQPLGRRRRDANDIVPALQREGVGVQTQKQDSGGFTMPADVGEHGPAHADQPPGRTRAIPAPVDQGIGGLLHGTR